MIIVSVLLLAPVGVVKRMVCVEVALTVRDDIVSEALVIEAASATLAGMIAIIASATIKTELMIRALRFCKTIEPIRNKEN